MTIPEFWVQYVPNASSAVFSVKLETFRQVTDLIDPSIVETLPVGDPVIGNFSAVVPARYAPHIDNVDVVVASENQVVRQWYEEYGIILQTYSSVTFKVNHQRDPSLTYTYTFKSNGGNAVSNGNEFTISRMTTSGVVTYTATVIDSRGRMDSYTSTINVVQYNRPSIVSNSCFRCNESGIASESGTYGMASMVGSVSPCEGRNQMRMSIGWSNIIEDQNVNYEPEFEDVVNNRGYIIGRGELDSDITWYIYFKVVDAIGTVTTAYIPMETAMYSIHVRKGGNGVAFGKTSEYGNVVEIAPTWDLMMKNKRFTLPLPLESGGTNADNVNEANRNITYAGVWESGNINDDMVSKWMALGANVISDVSASSVIHDKPST